MRARVCACEHLWVRGQSSRAPAADVQTTGGKSPPAKRPLPRKTAQQICEYIKINNHLKTLSKRMCCPERCSAPPPHSAGGGPDAHPKPEAVRQLLPGRPGCVETLPFNAILRKTGRGGGIRRGSTRRNAEQDEKIWSTVNQCVISERTPRARARTCTPADRIEHTQRDFSLGANKQQKANE